LVGDEKSKRAAILAMNSLGNTKLAAKVAAIFASEGTASALTSIAKQDDSEDKEAVHEALYRTLDALAEKYKYENNFRNAEETYRKAVALKEIMVGKDSPELTDSLDRLADLCDAHGDHTSAKEARARIASIKKRSTLEANGGANAAQAATTEDGAFSSKGANDGALWAAGTEPRSSEGSNTAVESVHSEQHEPSAQADSGIK
jgi:hypothetical protein